MKWTVEVTQEEVRDIAKAVSAAFVDQKDRALVVSRLFGELIKKGQLSE